MSLIYWWPFTDNTIDKINSKTFTSTNWSFQSNGKIGNCFAPSWTDSNTISRQIYADNVSIPETFSVAVWVKNNNNFNSPRTYCPIQFSNGDCWVSGANNKGWDFSHNSLRLIFNNGSNVSGSAGNAEVNWGYNPREFLGNWYHIAFTVNKTTRKAELFINGVSKGIKDLPSAVDTYGGTFKLKINWVQGWMLDGSLNDLRIYDHALSQAEVKELSKALVVHYSFNDVLAEPTTNIDPCKDSLITHSYPGASLGAISCNYGTFHGCDCVEMHLNASYSSSVWIYMNSNPISQGAKVGDTVTRSCWMYIPSGQTKPPHFTESIEGNSSGKTFVQYDFNKCDTWQRVSMTGTIADTGTNNYLHYFMAGSGTVNFKWYMRDFQMEIKDHATPYTPNSRDGMLVDESGNGYDGTFTLPDKYSLVKDTILGTYALRTVSGDPAARINVDIVPSFIKGTGTVCFWYKKDSSAFSYNGGQFLVATEHNSGKYLFATGSSPWSDKTRFTTWYVDGVERKDPTTPDQNWHFYCVCGVDISDWSSLSFHAHGDTSWLYRGNIADIRIYNTILSSSDIVDLYKTKAYITDKGDIMCGEFIEDKTDTMVTEKGTFECKEVYEEIDSVYEQLEYIESTSGYTQCIDTGYYWQSEAGRIDIDMEIRTLGTYQTLFGNEEYINSGSTRNFTHILHSGNSTGSFSIYNGSISSPGGVSLPIQQRFYLEFYTTSNKKVYIKKDGIFLINGNSYSDSIQTKKNAYTNSSTSTNVGHIFLFSNHNSEKGSTNAGTQHVTSMRVYNCKMYDNDVLVRNFIPCKRKSDNVLGLFDSVNKVFHTNAGSGTFGAGPSVTNNDASIYEDGHISGREIIEI